MKSFVALFFSSWRCVTFVIAVVVGYELFLLALLLLPSESSELAKFAEEFRTSCFGYDSATGLVTWIVALTTFALPLIVMLVISIAWWQELSHAMKTHKWAVIGYASAGFVVAFVIGVTLTAASRLPETGETPFPAEALRTNFRAPEFELKDHTGRTIQLGDLRGQVVLVTAIFSRCGYSCPIIMRDLQNTVATLMPKQLEDLRIAVITLDPENDTPEVLAKVATARDFTSPPFHLLSGEPAIVERTLDEFVFARSRNAETGFIDHTNLFILIDREGRIAYRFANGKQQQGWLGPALRALLDEHKPDT